MTEYSHPSRDDYEEFLIQVVYGPCADYLVGCIEAAYRDFCRTMRGFATAPSRNVAYCQALTTLLDRFRSLPNDDTIQNQTTFDDWHKQTSDLLLASFRENDFTIFAGQAQKWINMTFKNSFVCGSARVPGFDGLYDFCHMPIDNVVLDVLADSGVTRPSAAWSRWDYDAYFAFQKLLREKFGNQPLLNVEQQLWLEGR